MILIGFEISKQKQLQESKKKKVPNINFWYLQKNGMAEPAKERVRINKQKSDDISKFENSLILQTLILYC